MSAPTSTDPVYEFLSHVQRITGAYRVGNVTLVEMAEQLSRMAARFLVEAQAGEKAHTQADAALRRWTGGTAA